MLSSTSEHHQQTPFLEELGRESKADNYIGLCGNGAKLCFFILSSRRCNELLQRSSFPIELGSVVARSFLLDCPCTLCMVVLSACCFKCMKWCHWYTLQQILP